MRKIYLLIFIGCFLSLCGYACSERGQIETPQREIRAVWFCTLGGMDWPGSQYARTTYQAEKQKTLLRQKFDELKEAGINTILFQTRIRATTAYPSRYEPWDGAFSGVPGVAPPYDVLAFAIEEAHRRGMELHAYLVTFPICSVETARLLGKKALSAKHPEMCIRSGDRWIMDPGVPGTALYLARMVDEIVERYEVDGIHLDYIRYPEKEIPFNDSRTYRRYGHGRNKAQWRSDNVTHIVQRIYETVKSRKPWVKVTCAPVGKYADLPRYPSRGWNARDAVNQDVRLWLQRGWMDGLFPMMYFDGAHFFPFALNWQENSSGRPVAAGLGIYKLAPEEGNWELSQIVRQLLFVQKGRAGGVAFFRSDFLLNNTKGILDYLQYNIVQPVLPPAMIWADSVAPSPPTWKTTRKGESLFFEWEAVTDNTPITYNLYRYSDNRVALVVGHLRGTSFLYTPSLPRHLNARYVLTAMDAYGNESTFFLPHEKPHLAPYTVVYPSALRTTRR